ncbi:MAG: LLM class F420-dependent oxidoreductase [Dehalococcoidia bacterium]|nr:LLM class F420-dependent oxidoreductase [Dehalococcoidia bacterium]
MKFGIMLPHYRQVASADAIARVAKEAERLGYDTIWVCDHIIVPNAEVDRFGAAFYDPFSVLAYVSACTSRVGLGSSVFILPYRNPIQVAKTLSTIDTLSHGRLIVGVGVGALTAEFVNINAPYDDRGDYSDEALRIFKELWTNLDPQFEGKYYRFSDIQFSPKPVQQPNPPIWVGGNTRRALRRAVTFGDVWHPTRASPEMLDEMAPRLRGMAERAGRDPQEIGIAVRQPMKVVSDPAEAPDSWLLFGTAEQVIDGVGRFAEAGVGHFVLDTFYSIPELWGETEETMLETMERFATTVMPHFAEG